MRIATVVTALFLLSGPAVAPAWGQAGTLDPSFGSGGIAQPVQPQSGQVRPARTLVQADGGILILLQFTSSCSIVRLLPNGALDTGYGNQGVASLSAGGNAALDMALQADGKLLVGGETIAIKNNSYVYTGTLWRLNTNGTLDPGWGRNGALALPLPNQQSPTGSAILLMLVQPDGRIVLDATAAIGTVVERLNADGALDASFGSGGAVTEPSDYAVTSTALQKDGKIIVIVTNRGEGPYFTRLTKAGAADQSAAYGHVIAATGAGTFQPTGGFISQLFSSDEFALQRIGPQNVRDGRFATRVIDFASPKVPNDLSADNVLAAQGNGDVVAAGYWQINAGGTPDWGGVARVRANGTIDTRFATNGVTKVQIMGQTAFLGIALQQDGKIVLSGVDGAGLVVARYLGK